MRTSITVDELRRLTALDLLTLPRPLPIKDGAETIGVIEPRPLPIDAIDPERSQRITDLVRRARALAGRRTPEETAELQRWLDERER